jgi:hypothetical protein
MNMMRWDAQVCKVRHPVRVICMQPARGACYSLETSSKRSSRWKLVVQ